MAHLPSILLSTHRLLRCLVFLTVISAAACTGREPTTSGNTEALTQLQGREKALMRANDSLLTVLAQQKEAHPNAGPANDYFLNGATLKRHNVPAGRLELAAYLQEKHQDLIHVKGVLGGTMHFEEAIPLADEYVFASLSDGHIVAYGLYRYQGQKDGSLRWERVYASPPDQ